MFGTYIQHVGNSGTFNIEDRLAIYRSTEKGKWREEEGIAVCIICDCFLVFDVWQY